MPEPLSAAAQPGTRVRVRFSGTLVDGWVLERTADTDARRPSRAPRQGREPRPRARPEIVELARAVADRWSGHARRRPARGRAAAARRAPRRRSTRAARRPSPSRCRCPTTPGRGRRTPAARPCSHRLGRPRAAPSPPTSPGPARGLDRRAGRRARRGHRDAGARGAAGRARRARRRARRARRRPPRRGAARARSAAGTTWCSPPTSVPRRATAPSSRCAAGTARGRRHPRCGLRARAPTSGSSCSGTTATTASPSRTRRTGTPARCSRCAPRSTGAALVLGSPSRSVEAAQLVASGWAREVRCPARRGAPAAHRGSVTSGSDADLARDEAARSARLPARGVGDREVGARARPGARAGPAPRATCRALACQTCREPARCVHCHGPLGVSSGHAVPVCGWCGRIAGDWRCAAVRRAAAARDVGGGAAYGGGARPRVPRRARSARRAATRAARACSTRSTPGPRSSSPPRAPSRAPRAGTPPRCCSTAGSCSTGPTCGRPRRRVRRWTAAVSLVRPATEGGVVVLLADPALRARAGRRAPRPGRVRRRASWPSARRCACRPPGASPSSIGPPRRRRRPAGADAGCPRARRCSARCRSRPPPARPGAPTADDPEPRVRALVSVPRARGPALAAALHAAAGGPQRPQGRRPGHGAHRPRRPGLTPEPRGVERAPRPDVRRLVPRVRPSVDLRSAPRGRQAHPPVRRPGAHAPRPRR